MISENRKAHVALITANVLFGLNYSYSKSLIPVHMTPNALAMIRILFAAVLLTIIAVATKKMKVERGDIVKLVIASILGLLCNQILFLNGLRYTTPVDAAIITTGIPLLVLVISAVFIREKITALRLTGVVIGGVGALLAVVYGGVADFGAGKLGGNIMILVSSICYAGYLVWVKPLMEKYGPLTVTTYLFAIGAIFTLPFFGRAMVETDYAAMPGNIVGALLFVLAGATFAAYMCVAYGLKRVKPTTVSIYQYSQPVVASLFAVMRGQDTIDAVKIFAAALVFTGVFIVTQASRFEKKKI